MHIRISVRIKFHIKLTILTFRTKFAQKEYFRLKTKKGTVSKKGICDRKQQK